MKQATNEFVDEEVEVPPSALLRQVRKNRYGRVPGLEDDELADPAELERQVIYQEFAEILALPGPQRKSGLRPQIDEEGRVDWGAFGTVDFDRYRLEFDKARYRIDKLRDQVKDQLIVFDIIKEHLVGKAKYQVLKYLKLGWLDIDDIENMDMWHLARVYVRIRRLQREIAELKKAREERLRKKLAHWLKA